MTPRPTKTIEAVGGRRRSPESDDHRRGVIDHLTNSTPEPTILIFSSDRSLLNLAKRGAGNGWKLERCDDVPNFRESLVRPQVRLVIIDDEAIEDQMRDWLLKRVRSWAPQAPFVYVAGDHSEACEKRARAYAAGYYTSKPIEPESLLRVLTSFVGIVDRER